MSDKFKIVKSTQSHSKDSNFWSECPLKLNYLPTRACKLGMPQAESRCSWWINSAEHNYCFWKFIRAKSNSDGQMKELVQTDLARLFCWSNTKTHFIVKEAIQKLYEVLEAFDALEEFGDLVEDEVADIVLPDLNE